MQASAELPIPQARLLFLFEQIELENRAIYLKLIVVQLLSLEALPSSLNAQELLQRFTLIHDEEDDEDFSSIASEIIAAVIQLLHHKTRMEKKQEIENLLAELAPGYQKQNYLQLRFIAQQKITWPFFGEQPNHKIFDQSLFARLEEYYKNNSDFDGLSETEINELVQLCASSPATMMVLLAIAYQLPYDSRAAYLIQYFTDIPRVGENENDYASLLHGIDLYHELDCTLRERTIFENLYISYEDLLKEMERRLPLCHLLDTKNGISLFKALLFDEQGWITDLVNDELIRQLCYKESFYPSEQNLTPLILLFANREGLACATNIFNQDSKLVKYVNRNAFYRIVTKKEEERCTSDKMGWCPFSLALCQFLMDHNNTLIFDFYKKNRYLKIGLTYRVLSTPIIAYHGDFVLQKNDRCTAFGLMVQLLDTAPGRRLFTLLCYANSEQFINFTARDLCAIQTFQGREFSPYADLMKHDIGSLFISDLTTLNTNLNREILREPDRVLGEEEKNGFRLG